MTARDAFIKRRLRETAGMIALGTARARIVLVGAFNGSSSAERVLAEIEETATEFLGRMYDELFKEFNTERATTNGKTNYPAAGYGAAAKQ